MTPFAHENILPVPPADAALDDEALREMLKRCSPATYYAACKFRQTRDPALVPVIVNGVIERYVERNLRPKLQAPTADLRLAEDLGIDSLTMMEIVMLAEDVLRISIHNEELRGLRTLGDVQRFVDAKLRGVPPPPPPAETLT